VTALQNGHQTDITSAMLERQRPSDMKAEMAVLGSLLLRPEVFDEVTLLLDVDDFCNDAHQTLYRHILEKHDAGRPIDMRLLISSLKQSGDFELIGGESFVAEIARAVPTAAFAAAYAKDVLKCAGHRKIIEAGADAVGNGFDETLDPSYVAAMAIERFEGIIDSGQTNGTVDASTALDAAMKLARDRQAGGRGAGLKTGLVDFDRRIGGLFAGELVILAARPGMGKTSMALQIASHAAGADRPVLFASLEMSAGELGLRMACARAGVDSSRVRNGTLSDSDLSALEAAADELRETALHIEDAPSLAVSDIRHAARRMKKKGGLELVVVDYLTRLRPTDPRAARYLQVGQMSSQLKELARELDLPVLCLAQLNRESESSSDHVPRLAHLRESGDVEQDADVVMLLHRPEVFKREDPDLRGKAQLIVAKNRNGPIADFNLLWDAPSTTFRTPAPAHTQSTWEEAIEPTLNF